MLSGSCDSHEHASLIPQLFPIIFIPNLNHSSYELKKKNTHTHTHTHIYVYTFVGKNLKLTAICTSSPLGPCFI
jgi:hypothetical protein